MTETTDFGELRNDKKLINAVENFENNLKHVEEFLLAATEFNNYDELSCAEKVNLDNFLAYATNSLYWMFVKLKLNGSDSNEAAIKNELSRVRQTILREKQLKDLANRPIVDKDAASRFVKHGLRIPRDRVEGNEQHKEDV